MLALPVSASLIPNAKTYPSSWSFALALLYSRIQPHHSMDDMPTFTISGHAQIHVCCVLISFQKWDSFLNTSWAVCLSWPKPLALQFHSPRHCFTTQRIHSAQGFIFVTQTSVTTDGPSAGLISSIPRECAVHLAPSLYCQQWTAKQLFRQGEMGGERGLPDLDVSSWCEFSVLWTVGFMEWQMDGNMVFVYCLTEHNSGHQNQSHSKAFYNNKLK